MNEVESPPAPEEKHVWVQPRVARPSKPKKTPAISFMSEWCSQPLGCLPPDPFARGWWRRGAWYPATGEGGADLARAQPHIPI